MNIRKNAAYLAFFILSLLTAVLTFLIGVTSGICNLLSGISVLFAILWFIPIGGTSNISLGIFWLVVAFLFSEHGMQSVMIWLLTKLHIAKDMLHDFIMN